MPEQGFLSVPHCGYVEVWQGLVAAAGLEGLASRGRALGPAGGLLWPVAVPAPPCAWGSGPWGAWGCDVQPSWDVGGTKLRQKRFPKG